MRAAVLAALGIASTARAEDRTAAIKRMLQAQADALIASNEADFKKTATSDALIGLGLDRPQRDFVMQSDLTEPKKIAFGAMRTGWAGTCGWVTAEATFTTPPHPEQGGRSRKRTRRWVALVVPDADGVHTRIMQLAIAMPDNQLGTFKFISELPVTSKPLPLVALLADPTAMLAQLSTDPSTSVFGSAPTDRAFGPAAARQLLTRWRKLKLELVDARDVRDKDFYEQRELVAGDCAAAFGQVRLQRADKKHVLYRGFLIAKKHAGRWEVVAASYGADD